ncbi:hypothetical protein B0T14DRAFT_607078 [Immersiella caudata]|uniref:Protein kinase domain-containing protein n=1 Tax=Immersiella caudata TaxID=314043 RepID=A0AA39TX85_9PEZI|nr:hypothetical protein B0T14DRAFT_607078 [Immersiella caudata]
MGRLREKAGAVLDRLIGYGKRLKNRNGGRSGSVPEPPECHDHDGDPMIDAIRGNKLGISVWGDAGAPQPGTLRTCNDGGAELLFQASGELARGDLPREPAALLLAQGAQFAQEEPINALGDASGELEIEDDPEAIARREYTEMDNKLRLASLLPFGGNGFYIPVNHLHDIMNRDSIKTILPFIGKHVINGMASTPSLGDLAHDIFGRLQVDDDKKPAKSYRKILAILILIDKADTIFDFVANGVTDAQLPLQRIGGLSNGSRPFQLGKAGSTEPLPVFARWEHTDIEYFEIKQWEVLAPFFSIETTENNLVRHYELSSCRPLPFEVIDSPNGVNTTAVDKRTTSADSGGGSGGSSGTESSVDSKGAPMKGGHSKVWKVRIHQKHHNLPSYRGNEENPALAIKRLLAATRDEFKNEVTILTRLNQCNDPHLVKLLFTMEIIHSQPVKDTSFHLIFPLADGNLRQFWQRNFPHRSGTSTATYARWVAKQFHGLVFALCKLHDLHLAVVHPHGSYADDDREVKGKNGGPFYGIHGDIKPENLLWYEDWVGPPDPLAVGSSKAPEVNKSQPTNDSFGVLQLADFGISRLHHTESRSDTPLHGATKTYAPPEVEYSLGGCSRSFDIWGLGCVFLEFICWLVQGGSGKANPVDVFHDARYLGGRNRSLEGTIQDTFYHVVKENHRTTFEVNPEVNKLITTLKKGASKFVKEILDIILYDMLVVEARKSSLMPGVKVPKTSEPVGSDGKFRINCFELAKKLDDICKKNTNEYFTKPGSRLPETPAKLPRAFTINESAGRLVDLKRSLPRSFSLEKHRRRDGAKQEPGKMAQVSLRP